MEWRKLLLIGLLDIITLLLHTNWTCSTLFTSLFFFLFVLLFIQPNIMINLPRESTVGGSINSDRVDSSLLASNNPVKNGKTVDEAMDDVLQEEGRKRGNSFTGNCKDSHLPHRPWSFRNDVIKSNKKIIFIEYNYQLSKFSFIKFNNPPR